VGLVLCLIQEWNANATVGHGLGAAPKMIIVKNLDHDARGWIVYHASLYN
jgi:hypothetical protein